MLWHNEVVSGFITDFRHRVLPIVFSSLMHNIKLHWNPSVHQLTVNVVKSFNDMDPQLFEKCAADYKQTVEMSVTHSLSLSLSLTLSRSCQQHGI